MNSMNIVKVLDKEFKIFISAEQIQAIISEMANRMNVDFKEKKPLFLSVLNGSFLFTADLFKKINIDCEISFLKVASYTGTSSNGAIKTLIGLNEDIKNRTVIVLEDIVDTGNTIEHLVSEIQKHEPKDLKIATLLFKPKAFTGKVKLDYVGMEIPNDFVIGYGLDYNGLGRNLQNIYKIVEQ